MYIFTRKTVFYLVIVIIVLAVIFFVFALQSISNSQSAVNIFEIQQGESFRGIAGDLSSEHLIRSQFAFEVLAVLEGQARALKPGLYQLNPGMSSQAILDQLGNSANRAVSVTIPEGSNMYEIDAILAGALVIRPGQLIAFASQDNLEGTLFPDTYDFFPGSSVADVVQKMTDDFQAKAAPLLDQNKPQFENNLIIASLLEKEVPDPADQMIVAGIIKKRLEMGIPLDIDATICYAKLIANPTSTAGCYPITVADKEIDSSYNTYLYKGLPPGPIGNPGTAAITAAMNPQSSPYLYYLSDPKTGKTIYAATLAGQEANEKKYLQ